MSTIELTTCAACGLVQYPRRELCSACLSSDVMLRPVPARGRLLSSTAIHASLDPLLREHAPWRVGVVALDCGPRLIAYLASDTRDRSARVIVTRVLDPRGRAVWLAHRDDREAPADIFLAVRARNP